MHEVKLAWPGTGSAKSTRIVTKVEPVKDTSEEMARTVRRGLVNVDAGVIQAGNRLAASGGR